MAESGVEEQYIEASKGGNLPDVPELKCYILCLLEHSGMMEDDGTIHFNDVYHLLTPSMRQSVDKVVAQCETKRKHCRLHMHSFRNCVHWHKFKYFTF